MVTRHEFLAELHTLLLPRTYLEIGVQHGASLKLAARSKLAIGIDPYLKDHPLSLPSNFSQWGMTSNEYFCHENRHLWREYDYGSGGHPPVNLAFIDGDHRIESVLTDFINVEGLMPHGLIAFDDVLPRNEQEASREPCPGDWAGDAWKIHPILYVCRPYLELILVDTQPTGLLLVLNPDPIQQTSMFRQRENILKEYINLDRRVPDMVISREQAWSPQTALNHVKAYYSLHGMNGVLAD